MILKKYHRELQVRLDQIYIVNLFPFSPIMAKILPKTCFWSIVYSL